MKKWSELSVIQKIYIKQQGMERWGKRIHYSMPDSLKRLNELQINFLLS